MDSEESSSGTLDRNGRLKTPNFWGGITAGPTKLGGCCSKINIKLSANIPPDKFNSLAELINEDRGSP
jgi:hypothetical protein